MLDASIGYVRQFAPDVLRAIRFAGGTGTEALLGAVAVLAELYATGARKVPPDAPASFVPARFAGYLDAAAAAGNVTGYRHYWELCVLLGLRDGLRSGDVSVPGSRRYADPASFLLTPEQWAPLRGEFCQLIAKPATAADALALAGEELHAALADLDALLGKPRPKRASKDAATGAGAGDPGEVRLGEDGS
jgi:hypothetical protein